MLALTQDIALIAIDGGWHAGDLPMRVNTASDGFTERNPSDAALVARTRRQRTFDQVFGDRLVMTALASQVRQQRASFEFCRKRSRSACVRQLDQGQEITDSRTRPGAVISGTRADASTKLILYQRPRSPACRRGDGALALVRAFEGLEHMADLRVDIAWRFVARGPLQPATADFRFDGAAGETGSFSL